MEVVFFKLVVNTLFVALCVHGFQENYGKYSFKESVKSVALQWAPKIWLHPHEEFFPSNVTEFLREVTLVKLNCTSPSLPGVTVEHNSPKYFLTTVRNKEHLLKDKSSFLFGVNPFRHVVSVYAFVTTCDPHQLFISYWFFYPFNEGKDICTIRLGKLKTIPMLKLFKKCLGKAEKYGNHIGDWEHMTIEFKNWVPSRLFLSVHDVGVYYKYNKASHSFVVAATQARTFSQVQDPPPTVRLEGTHPQLFAAKGSHALWGSFGSYKYTKLKLDQLVDEVEFGTPWETWHNLQVFLPQEEQTPGWYNFRGKWGNPRSGCLGSTELCFYLDGPDGLIVRRPDFSCRL